MRIHPAQTPANLSAIRGLFSEYATWLGVDLTFQGFAEELVNLPGRYTSPAGCLLLATHPNGEAVGCVGVRPLDLPRTCEMKRLYVRESARGTGTGRALCTGAIAFAESSGLYTGMLLDTLPRLTSAVALFRSFDFQPVSPYYANPVPGALFFRRTLAQGGSSV